MNSKDTITTIVSSLMEQLPEVTVGKHINNTNFLSGKKVVGFIKNNGLVIKLPRERVAELVDKKYAKLLVMGKRVMQEWVVIEHTNPEDYKRDIELFKEAVAFVSEKAK
jgi:hypothetical protein